jgi:hypothetical protein
VAEQDQQGGSGDAALGDDVVQLARHRAMQGISQD